MTPSTQLLPLTMEQDGVSKKHPTAAEQKGQVAKGSPSSREGNQLRNGRAYCGRPRRVCKPNQTKSGREWRLLYNKIAKETSRCFDCCRTTPILEE